MKFITYSFKGESQENKQLTIDDLPKLNKEEFYLNAEGEPLPWEAEKYYQSLKKKNG